MKQCDVVLLLYVEFDAAFVSIDREEVRAFPFKKRWPPATRLIADVAPLDLNDLCAEVAEHHCAIRSRQRLRHLDDL